MRNSMKCLTFSESEAWLAPIGVTIDGNRNLLPDGPISSVMTTMPKSALPLSRLAQRIVYWVPHDIELLLWVSNWETEPYEPLVVFETLRRACGEFRPMIEAPGHSFTQPNQGEIAVLGGLMFLVMAYSWEAYLVARKNREFVFLGDEHIVFCSSDSDRMQEVAEFREAFRLKKIKCITEAWTQ